MVIRLTPGRHGVGFLPAAAAPAIAGSGPAAPFVAAALIAAPFVINLIKGMAQGCGQTCELTADAANQIEAKLKENLQAYQASGHSRAEQAAALKVFDAYWQTLAQYCGRPEFQSTKAGRNCIADRQAGACKWRGSDGQCWNWFIGYREPIANDPRVISSPAGGAPGTTAAGQFDYSNLLIPAVLVALALTL